MRLEPKAKPVRIRIRSCGKEHSTIESLKKSFNYEDVLLVNEDTLCRWLKQCSQQSIVSEIEGSLEKIKEPEERGLYLAKVLFEKDSGCNISSWDDLALYWITRQEYASNLNYVPVRKLSVRTLDDDRFIPYLKKDAQVLWSKLIANPAKYYYYCDDPEIRNQAQKVLVERAISEHDYEEAIRIGGKEVVPRIRFRVFLRQPTEDEKERFDRLRNKVELWLMKGEYGISSSLDFNVLRYDTDEIRKFYAFADCSIKLIKKFYSTRAYEGLADYWDAAYSVLKEYHYKDSFFKYLVLSTVTFLLDNTNDLFANDHRVEQLMREYGFSHSDRIDYSQLQEQEFRLSGVSCSSRELLFNHNWHYDNDPIGYKDAIVSILKDLFSLYG